MSDPVGSTFTRRRELLYPALRLLRCFIKEEFMGSLRSEVAVLPVAFVGVPSRANTKPDRSATSSPDA